MKTKLFAFATAMTLATAASAEDFDNTAFTLGASWDQFTLSFEGDVADGYNSATIGAEVLSHETGANTTGTLSASLTLFEADNEVELGAEYAVVYSPSAWTVYGAAGAEYAFNAETFDVTPTVGVSFVAAEAVDVFGQVGYTWEASDAWAAQGGELEVGTNLAVAGNVVLTPSVVYSFDQADGSANEAQLSVAVGMKF
jgi:hypothetical protein